MTKKTLARHLLVGSTLALFVGLLSADPVLAQGTFGRPPDATTIQKGLNTQNLGSTDDIVELIAALINYGLTFLGLLATLIILFSGFQWMTAGGDAAVTEKAKKRMIQGVVGLVIILSAWGLGNFVVKTLFTTLYS